MSIGIILLFICLLNLPFGYWRGHVRPFSFPWILAVHLPVSLVIIVNILGGIGWHIKTFPLLAWVYFMGQYLGGNIYTQLKRRNLQKYIPADSSFCDCSIDFSLEAP